MSALNMELESKPSNKPSYQLQSFSKPSNSNMETSQKSSSKITKTENSFIHNAAKFVEKQSNYPFLGTMGSNKFSSQLPLQKIDKMASFAAPMPKNPPQKAEKY